MMSVGMKRAYARMLERSKTLDAYDFGDLAVDIKCEDGSAFFIDPAFLQVWPDPDNKIWVFVFCEHYPDMVFDADDLYNYTEWKR